MVADSMDTSARPLPEFEDDDRRIFSTKKERTQSERKYRPPPPPHPGRVKSTFYASRVRSRLPSAHAVAISFKDDSDSSIFANGVYDRTDQQPYFDQCFDQKRLIGSGCFGEVYSARSKLDGRLYAVKKSRQRFRSDGDRRRRLEEVRKHERLPRHRHCVTFHAAWEEADHLYMQTELCGTSLADLSEANHHIPERTVWAYMVDLLLAVKHLHDNQLVHLDIKPENIFISSQGYCKLGDFGLVMDISASADSNDSDVTEGDPKYMAPELMRGRFSPAADIFSLGVTLLELACDLEVPRGDAGWHQLRSGRLPGQLAGRMSHRLAEVLQLMLTPDPDRRPSADQLLKLPAVRRRRRVRELQITAISAVSCVCEAVRWFFTALLSCLLFAVWLICWPVRRMARCVLTGGPAVTSGQRDQQEVTPADLRPLPAHGVPPDWVDPSFSDPDEEPLDATLDELLHSRSATPSSPVRNSTPKRTLARSTLRSRSLRQTSLLRAASVPANTRHIDDLFDPVRPFISPSLSRRLEESFDSCCTSAGDLSPVSRRRHAPRSRAAPALNGVQTRLDFNCTEFSDGD